MLVLSRRTNETLVIDNNIRFTVLSVHGNQVRIGIEAPEEVIILREEISPGAQRSANPPTTGDKQEGSTQPYGGRSNAEYRAHTDQHDHGRRRGVLGLRRRRP